LKLFRLRYRALQIHDAKALEFIMFCSEAKGVGVSCHGAWELGDLLLRFTFSRVGRVSRVSRAGWVGRISKVRGASRVG
jgi:hypothetical protein